MKSYLMSLYALFFFLFLGSFLGIIKFYEKAYFFWLKKNQRK
jgi:hypothetical protein